MCSFDRFLTGALRELLSFPFPQTLLVFFFLRSSTSFLDAMASPKDTGKALSLSTSASPRRYCISALPRCCCRAAGTPAPAAPVEGHVAGLQLVAREHQLRPASSPSPPAPSVHHSRRLRSPEFSSSPTPSGLEEKGFGGGRPARRWGRQEGGFRVLAVGPGRGGGVHGRSCAWWRRRPAE